MPRDPSRGTLGRRDMLLASGLGLTLAAAPSCAEDRGPPAPNARMVEGVSARAFGAIGDGQFHALAARFATLAQARAVYPFVERLDQSIDWAGIQAAINAAEGGGGTITIPVGRFVISDSLQLPSAVTLRGEARNGSVIDNQHHRLDAPQIVNKDPVAFLYVTIRDLTLNGGSHAIKVRATREVAGIVIEGITANLQTEANFTFSSMQTTVIRDCHLMDGKHGLSVEGFPCNSVHLDNTRLGRHSDASIRLRGADGFVMAGGSIEAGGAAGRGTIDVETGGAYANAIHFRNVYFENTHEFLLRSRGAKSIGFSQCKITGTGASGEMSAYRFDCGEDLIAFYDNHWDKTTTGPANMLLQGLNDGLRGPGTIWRERNGCIAKLISRRFSIAEAKQGLFAVEFGGEGGQCTGNLEIFFDAGRDRPVRRVMLPVDVASSARAIVAPSPPATRDVQLVVTSVGGKLRVAAAADANLAAGYKSFWFSLDLHGDTPGAMMVSVL